MRKLFLLSIVLFINYSCSSDDSSSQNYSNQDILGNWRITEYRDDFYNNISEVDDDEPCFSLSTKTYNSNLTLKDYYKYGSSCQNLGVNNKVFEINGNVLTAFNDPKIKIGLLIGSAFTDYVTYLYPKAKIVFYESSLQMLQSVADDQVDAVLMDELVVKMWLANKPERALRTRYIVLPDYNAGYAIATSYDYRTFGEWINEFVDEARAIGMTQRLLKKYTQGVLDATNN